MSTTGSEGTEQRVLLLLATARDNALTRDLLHRHNIQSHTCASAPALIAELSRGCAAVLVCEETMTPPGALGQLAQAVENQPNWSDLPVLMFTGGAPDSTVVGDAVAMLHNVTLLERPLRAAALLSAVRSALRARGRQYEIRGHLAVTERARAAEVEAMQRKDEFLAMLAHELRNPLAPINNALHLLAMDDSDPARRTQLREMMSRQVHHMVRLVDDLLEASRLSRGMITLHTGTIDLRDALAAAAELARPQIEAGRCRLALDLPDHPLPVEADPVRIAQVFGNLLNNAAKYGCNGGHVEVAARTRGDAAVVTVSDDGQGIAEDVLPRVFELFTQGEQGYDGAREGLGIGLALVRSLVELHGGTVDAHSDGPGTGARFTVTLPLARDQPVQAVPPTRRTGASEDARGDLRVLVVDDNLDAAASLGLLVESLGLRPRIAHDGREALAKARTYRPQLVLLDIGMPGMDGYEVARRLLADSDGTPPVLAAVTGWNQPRDRRRAREAGFSHHFAKPADVEAIADLIQSLRPAPGHVAGQGQPADPRPALAQR